jgi:hypothetical protein
MSISWRVRHIAPGGGISVYQHLPCEMQAMEMTEYGKHGSHEAGFPPFPHSLEIPSGFPHSHDLDDWIYVFSCPLNWNRRHRKGLVTDVSGPQRNACPGTLTPLSGFGGCGCLLKHQGRRCGQEQARRDSLSLCKQFFLFRGVQRGYFSFSEGAQ